MCLQSLAEKVRCLLLHTHTHTHTPIFPVHLKVKRRPRGKLPSAVGPKELFRVVENMYRGKGKEYISKMCIMLPFVH